MKVVSFAKRFTILCSYISDCLIGRSIERASDGWINRQLKLTYATKTCYSY